MTKKASAVWTGSFNQGQGAISTESGALNDAPYGVQSRFEQGSGTNPEELIAAAHAGCFSMALALMLSKADMAPEKIETQAEVKLEKQGEGFTITSSHLTVNVRIPGADQAKFDEIANQAKDGCPVSKVLNATITMQATLQS